MAEDKRPSFNYFIKGDISGIQEFIFNVKSEKAARVLKARSIIVQLITDFILYHIEQKFSGKTIRLFDGGGNFYLWADIENIADLQEIQLKLNKYSYKNDFAIILSYVENNHVSFGELWKAINIKSSVDKQKIYSDDIELFEPFDPQVDRRPVGKAKSIEGLDITQQFAQHLPKKVAELANLLGESDFDEKAYSLSFLNRSLFLKEGKKIIGLDYFDERITTTLPTLKGFNRKSHEFTLKQVYKEQLEENKENEENKIIHVTSVIDFEMLAHFAYERTGTEKLGILKMDVDNLSDLFSNLSDDKNAKQLSKQLKEFFDKKILDLLREELPQKMIPANYKVEGRAYKFGDNIYTIFSGGDDCFFVGAWDVVLEWAWKINDAFKDYVEQYSITYTNGKLITISAAVVIVHAKYPVVRFAEIAEEALSNAKRGDGKNSISVFDEVLTWQEFYEAREYTEKLVGAVNNNDREIRAFLNKIQHSADLFKIHHEQAASGKLILPSVWKLFYTSRNRFKKERTTPKLLEEKSPEKKMKSFTMEDATTSLINNYYLSLMKIFLKKEPVNPMKYPLIARWTELLTRKSQGL